MHPNPRRIIPIVLVLAALAALGYWYFEVRPAQANGGALTASGTIEITQVTIAPEIGGRVLEVLAEEGQSVLAGQTLVRFDDQLLRTQLAQAQAALALAQANLELVVAGTPPDQRQAAITAAELELTSARQALQNLHDTADLAKAQAELGVAGADKALKDANDRLDSILGVADPEDVERAEAQIIITKDALKKAQEDYDKVYKYYKMTHNQNVGRAYLQIKLANAQDAYDQAVTRLNNIVGQSNRWDVAVAESNVTVAEAALADAKRQLDKVKAGPDPDALKLAEQRLDAAEAGLTAAQAGPSEEQLAVARQQVQVSQAAVDVLKVQMEKLVINAPLDGVVLTRVVEPGETALAGSTLLILGLEADKTITVYVPEERYGAISLGQEAAVSADSFPGTTFTAGVIYISDKAEFTPRNVATVEGRKNTVFAIRLQVTDPEDRLKAGMPVDVTFQ
jgi:HlyD family secretion protein